MKIAEKIRSALSELDLDLAEPIIVAPSGAGRFVVVVISSTFEGMPEEHRQDIVLKKLIERLDDDEQARIEYVFTSTPSELPADFDAAKSLEFGA